MKENVLKHNKYIISILLMLFSISVSADIVVHDLVDSFVCGYYQLADKNHTVKYVMQYESNNYKLLNAAYYNWMSIENKEEILNSADLKYAFLEKDIDRYNQQTKLIKEIINEVEQRYKKILSFDSNFDVYIWTALPDSDGRAFWLEGKPVFAINMRLAINYNYEQLRIFIAHELYHLYQMNNVNKEQSKYDILPISFALWNEGLATYISSVIYPNLSDWRYISYYQNNDLEYKQYINNFKQIIKALEKNIYNRDQKMFGKFFSADPNMSKPLPPRSGYFIGYHMFKELAKNMSSLEIANMTFENFLSIQDKLLNCIQSTSC